MGTQMGISGTPWWQKGKSSTPPAPAFPTFDEVFGSGSGTKQGGGMGYMDQDNPYSKAQAAKLAKATGKKAGGAGGGGTGGTGGTGGNGGTTNTAQISPYLQRHLDRYEDRFDVDNTQRAIDRATMGTMDAAALAAKDLGANTARRGVTGTGVGTSFLQKRVFDPAQRHAAGQAADISMQREKDLDSLVLGGTSLMRSPDDISLANRDLALRTALGYEDVGLRQGQLDLQEKGLYSQQQQDAWAMYMAMLGLNG